MKYILLILILLGQGILLSQIGPCSIEGGDKDREIYLRKDNIPDNYSLGRTGDNNLWNFNTLRSPRSFSYKYLRATEGRYSSYFEDADMVLKEPLGREIFFMQRSGGWYELGYVSFKNNSIAPSVIKYKVPINTCVPDSFGKRSTYKADYTTDNEEVTVSYTDVKDASGTLYLTDQYYDAYRVRREKTETIGEKTATAVSYIFVDQILGTFLAEVTLDDIGRVDHVLYKSTKAPVGASDVMKPNSFLLYPNIGYGEVRLEFLNFEQGTYQFIVKDVIGKQVWKTSFNVPGDVTLKEDLSFLPRGTYTYSIVDSNQNNLVTRRLAIIKS